MFHKGKGKAGIHQKNTPFGMFSIHFRSLEDTQNHGNRLK